MAAPKNLVFCLCAGQASAANAGEGQGSGTAASVTCAAQMPASRLPTHPTRTCATLLVTVTV